MLITRSRQLLSLAGWLAVLYAVLYLRVVDFVLTFCLGGVIPGTSVSISPVTAMGISAAAVSVTGYALLLHVRTVRARRLRYYTMRQPVALRRSRIFAAQMNQMAPRDAKDSARGRRLFAVLPSLRRTISDGVFRILALSLWLIMRIIIMLAEAIHGTISGMQSVVRRTKRAGIDLRHALGQKLSEFWQWFDPLLWSIDEWLEIQFRAGEAWTARKLSQSPSLHPEQAVVDDWTARPVTPAGARPELTQK